MKRMKLFLVFALLLLLAGLQTASATDIWTIGVDDDNFAEFASAGKYEDVPKNFPQGVNIQIGKLDTKKDFPYIHPAPSDVWAEKKNYAYSIQFDLPENTTADENNTAYELTIKGWGHYNSPTVFDVNLNGQKKTLATSRNAKSDDILTNPQAAKPGTYSIAFPKTAIKETGNILTITSVNGSWFVYDVLKFQARTGKIEAINITPIRGIFKTKNSDEQFPLARKINIDYQGEFLSQTTDLAVTYQPENGEEKQVLIALDPEKNFTNTEILLPVTNEDCVKPIKVRAELKTPKAVTKETFIPAERKWEIHLIHQTHLDIGYTHTQVEILERQVQSLKDALKYIEETKNYPDDAKFKFHPEGMWAVEEFMRRANDEEKTAFIQAAKNRNIHLDVMYAQAMTGMYSDEELFELMGSAIRFGRKYSIEIDSAMQTDVPGYTWGLVPVLAKCGIKYMTMGPNAGHRVGRLYYWGEKPFYWESPSGKERVLCYLADTGYHQFHGKPVGHRISETEIFNILDGKDWLPHSDKPRTFLYDLIPLRYGIEGDNGRPNRVVSDVVKEWNEKYAYPKLTLSRNSDFMKELEMRYGKEFPVVRGDYTPYWEDGAASTSVATMRNRDAKRSLIAAETAWAIKQPQEYFKRVTDFDAAWTDIIMYDEHTWGAHNSISEPDSDFVKQQDDYKQAFAQRAFDTVNKLREEVKINISPPQHKPEGVYADTEKGMIGNDLISLKVDKKTGAIVSFTMKGIPHDLVNPNDDGNTGLNDYLYIIGRDATKNRERYAQGVNVTARVVNGVASINVESLVPNCQFLQQRVVITSDSPVVYIDNTMKKKMERQPEGTFFGFPFNIPNGVWRIDTPWAMVQVEKDQLPGANRNYYCVQNFCNLSNDDYGIDFATYHAPMIQFSPILFAPAWDKTLKTWREHIEPNGTIYSWVCNNHWETNYKAGQDGWLRFVYKIRPYVGKFDVAKSQKFARDEDSPVPLYNKQLMNLDNENIIITRLKPARTEKASNVSESPYGQGLIVRLYNPTDKPQKVSLTFSAPQINKDVYEPALYRSNPLEDCLEKIPTTLVIDPFDFITLRAE
ncbi:MAG: hypothetical protein LBK82_16345 [Planctomycetaceae bacterium]|jgi:hypothetical protein|nr:hypothetical protein [Planctomycetaceae bacterium]